MKLPTVSAIVLNFRDPQETVQCVMALLHQAYEGEIDIIVIDNHSRDDSIGVLRNRLRSFPSVSLIETQNNIGFSRGINEGIKRSSSKYLLIMNPDNIIEKNGIQKMIQKMEDNPTIGILGPKLIHEDGTVRDSRRRFPLLRDVIVKRSILHKFFTKTLDRYLLHDRNLSTSIDVDWVVGTCMMIRHSVLEEIGYFDKRFFLFFEDIDLCRRCKESGKRVVYDPTVIAEDAHIRLSDGGMRTLLLTKVGRAHLKSAAQYFWKWRNAPPLRSS